MRDRLFDSLPAWGRRRHCATKAGWFAHWFRPSLQVLEPRRVLTATSYLHPDGTAFQVADSPFGDSVAADGNGNTIATWEALPSGSTNLVIYAQQFNDQGQAQGSAFVVAGPLSSGSVQSVGVVADASGDFAVIWYATAANGTSSLEAQRYNSQGQAQASTLPLPGDARFGDQFALNAQGDLLVVYQTNTSLLGQRYDTQNNLIGGAFQINPTVPAAGFQLAADPTGDFMVTWFEQSASSNPASVYARGYNADGVAQSSEFLVVSSSDTTSAASGSGLGVAGYGSGDFLIQWQNQTTSSTSLLAERFNMQGAPLDDQFQIATVANVGALFPSAAAASDGSFLEVGLPPESGADALGLFAEQFNAQDAPQGAEFPVTLPGTNVPGGSDSPLVFAVGTGNYLINWHQSISSAPNQSPSYVSYYVASATNQAPQTAAAISNQSVAACDLYQLSLAADFTDPDSDPLTYSAVLSDGSPLPSWLSLDSTGLLSGIPPLNIAGASYPIQVTATDMNGASVSETFTLSVTPEAHGETGGQFSVNGTGNQVAVATNASGTEVVISATANGSIVGQLYSSQGQASGSQFVVTAASGNDLPGLPAVAENAAGDFVVTWVESTNGATPTTLDIPGLLSAQAFYMQAFNASAIPSGPATQLALPSGNANPNGQLPQGVPQVVADGTGEFDVAWLGTSLSSNTTVWLQRFDAGGAAQGNPVNALGSSFSIPNPLFDQQPFVGIAADNAGDLTLMWGTNGTAYAPTTVTGTINIQRFDANNNPLGSPIQVAASASSVSPVIAEDAAGDVEVAWWQYTSGMYSLEVQPYSTQGNAVGNPETIGAPSPYLDASSLGNSFGSITADPAGHFLLTWYGFALSTPVGTSTNEVYGQLLNNQGNSIGGPFLVNTTSSINYPPSAAMDAAGNFVVAWAAGPTGIDGQRYEPGVSLDTPSLQATVENSPLVFAAANSNQIAFGDGYNPGDLGQLELTAPDGTLSLGSTTGIDFVAGVNGSSTMTIQGTVVNLNAALAGLSFTPTSGFTGMASLTIDADDLGNSGTGGHLTTSTTVSIDVLAQSPIQLSGSTITVNSTGLGDNFFLRFPSASQLQITLDGWSQTFNPANVTQVAFNGLGDSVATVSGDGSTASAIFQPNTLTFTLASGLGVAIQNTPSITAAGDGSDQAVFYGGAGANTFVGMPTASSMSGQGTTNQANGFGTVVAVAGSAADVAYLYDTAGTNTFVSTPTYAELSNTQNGQQYFLEAEGFQHALATSAFGASDTAYFYDSNGSRQEVSTFVATPTTASMTGAGFDNSTTGFTTTVAFGTGTDSIAYLKDMQGSNTFVTTLNYAYFVGDGFDEEVIGIPQVIGTAASGTNDTDYMYGLSSGGNDFYGYAGSDYLFGGGMDDWAVGFKNVLAVASGGVNQAFFTGGPENNTFFGYSNFSAMTGSNYDDGALGFTTVYAVGGGASTAAELFDSSGNDSLSASGDSLQLSYPDAQIGLSGIGSVTATSSQGGTDTKSVQAIDFALTTVGPWVNS